MNIEQERQTLAPRVDKPHVKQEAIDEYSQGVQGNIKAVLGIITGHGLSTLAVLPLSSPPSVWQREVL